MEASTKSRYSLLLAAFFIAPVLNLFSIWPLESAVLTGVSYILVALLCLNSAFDARRLGLKVGVPFYFAALLFFVVVISSMLGDYAFGSSWKWYLINVFSVMFLILFLGSLSEEDKKYLAWKVVVWLWFGSVVLGFVGILKYYGLLSFVFPWLPQDQSRLLGVWNQPNLTTVSSWIGLVSGCAIFANWKYKLSFWAGLFILGWVIASAASRTSWIILLALFLSVLVLRYKKNDSAELLVFFKILLLSLVVVLVMMVSVPLVNVPIKNFLVSAGLLEMSGGASLLDRDVLRDSARLSELKKVLAHFPHLPLKDILLGVGPGNYAGFSYKFDMVAVPQNISSGVWLHSHNIFTMLLVELGVIGVSIFSIFVFWVINVFFRKNLGLVRLTLILVLGVIFIHSNLEYPLWYPWFLFFTGMTLSLVFQCNCFPAQSEYLKPVAGTVIFLVLAMLVLNVGNQYLKVVDVALEDSKSRSGYQQLALLANDGLMGPYSILRKYYDYAPESGNIDWQLDQVKKMKQWQPRDLVLLREYTLLVMSGDIESACASAKSVAYRYPNSAPIMVDHAVMSKSVNMAEVAELAECIDAGLEPWDENLVSMKLKLEGKR